MSKPYKITFFSQLYYPDLTTTAVIMQDLAEDLSAHQFQIEIICAQPTYVGKQKCPNNEIKNDVSIKRIWTFTFNKNKMFRRLLNSTSCFLSMLLSLASCHQSDLLIFNTNPAMLPLLGFISNRIFRSNYVVLVHDLWPELPAHTSLIKKHGIIYKIIDYLNTLSFSHASGIIVLSKKMKHIIKTKTAIEENKIHLIPNWTDSNRVYPVPEINNNLLKQLKLQNKKIVMYSGNIGRYQPMEVMLEAAEELTDRDDIVFLFIGDGGKKEKLQRMAEKKCLSNVRFYPFQPVERLAESLSMADISLVGIYPDNEGVIMPSKLYGLLAVGKPIICVSDTDSEVAEILNSANAGIQSSIHSPKELAENIRFLINNPETARTLGKNGRTYFLDHFERKIVTGKWKTLLEYILSNQTSKTELNFTSIQV